MDQDDIWDQPVIGKGLATEGGDCPKAFQVSSLASNAHCINCLGFVVIVENRLGRRCGVMTTTLLANPAIRGDVPERSDFMVL